jgi:hypothetical protein
MNEDRNRIESHSATLPSFVFFIISLEDFEADKSEPMNSTWSAVIDLFPNMRAAVFTS